MAPRSVVLLFLTTSISLSVGLENGLGLTPPMGWLTWERFRCITDCQKYPNECISDKLVKRTADLLVREGYRDAGYVYLGIDDCWLENKRGPDGRLVPNRRRFPNGMKEVADYIHNQGLKFGLYQDYGNQTCAGYPGVLGHELLDITTFVGWDVDYIKLDGCYIDVYEMDKGYPAFGTLLNATGRPVLYSCSWPSYQESKNIQPDYKSIAKYCNLWRNWDDINDSWSSVKSIMNWFGDNQNRFASHAGPGHWNDPDMLIIGNFGLSFDQARVQMAIWSILAAPLLISADLATIKPEFKEILLNEDIIAVNQDRLGKQGLRVFNEKKNVPRKDVDVWTRELHDGSYAVAFVNLREDGAPYTAKFSLQELNLPTKKYTIKDLYNDDPQQSLNIGQQFEVRINPTGVKFYKFFPESCDEDEDIEDLSRDNIVNTNNVKSSVYVITDES